MAQEMDKFMGTSEDEEEDVDMKDEDEEDEHHHNHHHHHQEQHYQESRNHPTTTTTTDDTTGMMMMINTDEQGGGGGISSFQNNLGGGNHDHPLEEDQEQNQNHQMGGGMRRCRPKEEKERTKLRERHRRAITARILAGLRRHGNYNLRVRADINDVIGALAREAGWVVLPDGTTFPSRSSSSSSSQGVKCIGTSPPPPPNAAAAAVAVNSSLQSPMASLQCGAPLSSVRGGISPGVVRSSVGLKSVYVPASLPYDATTNSGRSRSFVMAGGDGTDNSTLMGSCMDSMDDKQPLDTPQKLQERDFAGTPYVPVYVMLPLGVINKKCELVDPDGLLKQLRILKSVNVDGVMVDCWWGIVEADGPQEYKWYGYKRLFQLVRDLKLKLQVVMSFHECGGNVGDDVCIPLPHWVAEIGRTNADIFFTDKAGRRNSECLSWGIDKERVLRGRTAVEVYFDYMRSFRVEFDEFFEDGVISEIEIGLGPCGELRYPSYPVKHGWRYPGIGEFQCYDQYMMKSLTKAAEARGHSFWSKGPDNAGSYNVQPHDTGFFCDGGDYDSYYGRFFLNWYSQFLLDHADRVLSLAKLAFEGSNIAVKLSGIHWWYKTASHASELTAGFYNPCNRDGYAAIATVLKKHDAALNFTCVELRTLDQQEDFPEALADPEGLVWQVLNAAWDVSIPVASENALPCYDREGYNKILENAKPVNDPDGRHLVAFTYLRLSSILMERHNFVEFERFVKRMHGEAVLDLQMQ